MNIVAISLFYLNQIFLEANEETSPTIILLKLQTNKPKSRFHSAQKTYSLLCKTHILFPYSSTLIQSTHSFASHL